MDDVATQRIELPKGREEEVWSQHQGERLLRLITPAPIKNVVNIKHARYSTRDSYEYSGSISVWAYKKGDILTYYTDTDAPNMCFTKQGSMVLVLIAIDVTLDTK